MIGEHVWNLCDFKTGQMVRRVGGLNLKGVFTREPDTIDLFAAETGAGLAETVYLLGNALTPEVVQRVRHKVERRIFKPYLAYGRK